MLLLPCTYLVYSSIGFLTIQRDIACRLMHDILISEGSIIWHLQLNIKEATLATLTGLRGSLLTMQSYIKNQTNDTNEQPSVTVAITPLLLDVSPKRVIKPPAINMKQHQTNQNNHHNTHQHQPVRRP